MFEETADIPKTAAGAGKPEAEALLEAANSSSERVAAQHLAFMVVCAYVLTIVFSTTHFDLLIGKGIRLPVVNVDVPIVGFYAFAPFIVVLIHFNLLLQLQLLSRKLFAFEAAAPPEEGLGGLRDRLHIFPYTYYLVGRPSPLVQPLMGLMVSITVVLLPLVTLLALQLEFLAYQNEAVTWCQRLAIWLDILAITILWPLIMHPRDDWCGYWRDLIAAYVPRRRVWLAFALLFAGFVLMLFGLTEITVLPGLVLLLVSALSVAPLRGWKGTSWTCKLYLACFVVAAIFAGAIDLLVESQVLFLLGLLLLLPLAVLWNPLAPRGSLALLLALFVGLLLPPALLVDDERLERHIVALERHIVVLIQPSLAPYYSDVHTSPSTKLSGWFLREKRRLSLNEQVLLAKAPKPETLAQIRSGEWQEGLRKIEPLNLQDRHLRHARLSKVILIGADLRDAKLRGALLEKAKLQGANLEGAELRGAHLEGAELQGANLEKAQLQSAFLLSAQLRGANLEEAQLQGANLEGAELRGAHLQKAQLQHANLRMAELQGADLRSVSLRNAWLEAAKLQGANLQKAELQGVDLGFYFHVLGAAQFQGVNLESAGLQGAYLRGANLRGANLGYAQLQGADLGNAQLQGANLRNANLYAASINSFTKTELVDARKVVWEPLADDKLRNLSNELETLKTMVADKDQCQRVLERLKKASRPGAPKLRLQSCLAPHDSPLDCATRYDPQKPKELKEFKKRLHDYLAKLTCESPEIARGLIRQIPERKDSDSSRKGLEVVLRKRLDDKKCKGLQGLSPEEKDKLRALK
ncbi:MAG: pentapeptide repeat-containing protein [Thermodesulfobacteriota bacterium]